MKKISTAIPILRGYSQLSSSSVEEPTTPTTTTGPIEKQNGAPSIISVKELPFTIPSDSIHNHVRLQSSSSNSSRAQSNYYGGSSVGGGCCSSSKSKRSLGVRRALCSTVAIAICLLMFGTIQFKVLYNLMNDSTTRTTTTRDHPLRTDKMTDVHNFTTFWKSPQASTSSVHSSLSSTTTSCVPVTLLLFGVPKEFAHIWNHYLEHIVRANPHIQFELHMHMYSDLTSFSNAKNNEMNVITESPSEVRRILNNTMQIIREWKDVNMTIPMTLVTSPQKDYDTSLGWLEEADTEQFNKLSLDTLKNMFRQGNSIQQAYLSSSSLSDNSPLLFHNNNNMKEETTTTMNNNKTYLFLRSDTLLIKPLSIPCTGLPANYIQLEEADTEQFNKLSLDTLKNMFRQGNSIQQAYLSSSSLSDNSPLLFHNNNNMKEETTTTMNNNKTYLFLRSDTLLIKPLSIPCTGLPANYIQIPSWQTGCCPEYNDRTASAGHLAAYEYARAKSDVFRRYIVDARRESTRLALNIPPNKKSGVRILHNPEKMLKMHLDRVEVVDIAKTAAATAAKNTTAATTNITATKNGTATNNVTTTTTITTKLHVKEMDKSWGAFIRIRSGGNFHGSDAGRWCLKERRFDQFGHLVNGIVKGKAGCRPTW
eukprot:CAMPEP_0183746256 /NCGR_PEP_ID=MMETSP0737-20130205/66656_1 /TAXON_ID=385413 /ORGANISM="Thalassiosira miniscula, Strain CCMP1093" /LENGTH=648 /DNA_ID=CAMNT_0025981943 /DNA_START=317 /DNA_END=2263 /DNA_ORIENTATION=+